MRFRGTIKLIVPLFLCAQSANSAGLTLQDHRYFLEYYARLGMWDHALHFSDIIIQTRPTPSKDQERHAMLLWELNHGETVPVLNFLKSAYSSATDASDWIDLWGQFQSKLQRKESIQRLGLIQVELQSHNCTELERLIASFPDEDKSSRPFRKARFEAIKKCQPLSKLGIALRSSIEIDPFWEENIEMISECGDICRGHLTGLTEIVKRKWARLPVQPIVESLKQVD